MDKALRRNIGRGEISASHGQSQRAPKNQFSASQ
jgi:hypothetical protein